MELELRLEPGDAPRLLRLPLLGSATRGRAQAQRIVWHDTADAALTAANLALAQERGAWRLEKLVPDPDDVWPPGAPPPVLAQAADTAALGYDLPQPLAPAVAFAGRRRTLALNTEYGAVTATLLTGTLRAVTEEHQAARLHLSGEERAVLWLAQSMSAELPVTIAGSLAAEAQTTARAAMLPRRRGGAPELPEGLAAIDAFAFALSHLTDVVLDLAPAAAEDRSGPEPVHQMRVALRRLRSVVSVFRPLLDSPELQEAAAGLKALSGRLGPTRDWDVFLGETLTAVSTAFPQEQRLARLVAAAARRRRECHAALRDFLESAEFRRLGIDLAWLAGARCWHPTPQPDAPPEPSLTAFAAEVLGRRLRKLQRAEDLTELDAASLHAVRLKAKRTRYAAELFAPLYAGKAPRRFIDRLGMVQDVLGLMNDRATAEKLLDELGGPGGRHGYAVGLVLGFTAAHTVDLLPRMERRWARFQRAGHFWE